MQIRRFRGSLTVMSFRLCSRAPWTTSSSAAIGEGHCTRRTRVRKGHVASEKPLFADEPLRSNLEPRGLRDHGGPVTEQHEERLAIRTGMLARPLLARRLDGAFGKRLIVVTADAGFGKTSLLRMWAADLEHAWYTLTAADRELETLVRGVAASVLQALPHLGALSAGAMAEPVDAQAEAAWICRPAATDVQQGFMPVSG